MTDLTGGGRRRRGRRHRRPAETARTIRVNASFTAAEFAFVDQAAEAAGVTPAGYVAAIATAAAHTAATPELDALRAATGELLAARNAVTRIGANLNQATAALNATGVAPVWLADAVALCARTVSAVDDVLARLRRAVPR